MSLVSLDAKVDLPANYGPYNLEFMTWFIIEFHHNIPYIYMVLLIVAKASLFQS